MSHEEHIRDTSKAFVASPSAGDVVSLKLWHCSYRSLAELSQYRRVQTLVIATYPDESLDPIGCLTELRYLRILHLPKVGSLGPLATLTRLEVLELATLPSWDSSGKVTVVDSLSPLTKLPRLKHLALFGLRPVDKSLSALETCPSLVSARFHKYPKKEVRRFFEVTGLTDDHVPPPDFEVD